VPKKENILRFVDATQKDANNYAEQLRGELEQNEGVEIIRSRERDDTQDFGATLVLVLGTASVTAVAHGIASWLQRNSGATIEVTCPDGSRHKYTHLDSHDAAKIAGALQPSP
jgi:hypothetical protein